MGWGPPAHLRQGARRPGKLQESQHLPGERKAGMSAQPEPFPTPAPCFGAVHLPGTLGGFPAAPTPGCTPPGTTAPAGSRDPLSPGTLAPAHPGRHEDASALGSAMLGTRGISYLWRPQGHQDQFHPRHQCRHLGALGRGAYQCEMPPLGYGWPERCKGRDKLRTALGGEGDTVRQHRGWVPQTWAQGPGSSVLSAPGGSGLANAPFSAHQDVPGSPRISGDPCGSSTSHLQPPSSMGNTLLTQPPRGHQESLGAAEDLALPCLASLPCPASLPGPALHRTPSALTSFRSSLERSGRDSTWEDASGEETCSTCGEENNQREHPQKAASEKVSCPPHRPWWAQGVVSRGGLCGGAGGWR